MLSYIDAVLNLSDLGTKLRGNLPIWIRFVTTVLFSISFLGRTKAKEAADQIQEQESKENVAVKKIAVYSTN